MRVIFLPVLVGEYLGIDDLAVQDEGAGLSRKLEDQAWGTKPRVDA